MALCFWDRMTIISTNMHNSLKCEAWERNFHMNCWVIVVKCIAVYKAGCGGFYLNFEAIFWLFLNIYRLILIWKSRKEWENGENLEKM